MVDSYFENQKRKTLGKKKPVEPRNPSHPAVTSAAKFLNTLVEKAGCDSKIQLLTVKSFYESNGYPVLLEIQSDQQYFDTVYIKYL